MSVFDYINKMELSPIDIMRGNLQVVSRKTSRSINRAVFDYQAGQICFYWCYLWVALVFVAFAFHFVSLLQYFMCGACDSLKKLIVELN